MRTNMTLSQICQICLRLVVRAVAVAVGGCLLIGLSYQAHAQGSPINVQTIAALRAIDTTSFTNDTVTFVFDYYSPSSSTCNRGGGHFRWLTPYSSIPGSPLDDGGRYIASSLYTNGLWQRIFEGQTPSVLMWGAHGDNSHNDTVAIQNAINACEGSGGSFPLIGELLFPAGDYLITNTLVFNATLLHIRGESSGNTVVHMASGYLADIFETGNAQYALQTGMGNFDHELLFENITLFFDGGNTNNSALVVCDPGEVNTIRNIQTVYGAIGIRCLGGGAPGLKVRDVTLHEAAIASLCIEPLPGQAWTFGDPISVIGISGDQGNTNLQPRASLILFSNVTAGGSISQIKAEGQWGGGVVQYIYPDAYVGTSQMTALSIDNSLDLGGGVYSSNFVILKGTAATPSIFLSQIHLDSVKNVISDQVTGRNVEADINLFTGNAQQIAQLPLVYQATSPGPFTNQLNSRLVMGQTAFSYFYATNTNWFRVMTSFPGGGRVSGKLTLSLPGLDSTEIEVDMNPNNSTAPWLNVTRCIQGAFQPVVTEARGFYYYDSTLGGDIGCVDVMVGNPQNGPYVMANPKLGRMTVTLDINGYQLFDDNSIQLVGNIQPVSATLPAGATATYVNTYR